MQIEKLKERTDILKQACEIRLGAGRDTIAIIGRHGVTRYLDAVEALLEGLLRAGIEEVETSMDPKEYPADELGGAVPDLREGSESHVPSLDELLTSLPKAEPFEVARREASSEGASVMVCTTLSVPIVTEEEYAEAPGTSHVIVVLPKGTSIPPRLLEKMGTVRVVTL